MLTPPPTVDHLRPEQTSSVRDPSECMYEPENSLARDQGETAHAIHRVQRARKKRRLALPHIYGGTNHLATGRRTRRLLCWTGHRRSSTIFTAEAYVTQYRQSTRSSSSESPATTATSHSKQQATNIRNQGHRHAPAHVASHDALRVVRAGDAKRLEQRDSRFNGCVGRAAAHRRVTVPPNPGQPTPANTQHDVGRC